MTAADIIRDRINDPTSREQRLLALVALDAAMKALEDFANPQHWAVTREADGHPRAVWIGTYQQSPVDFARAALSEPVERQKPQ